MYSYLQGSIVSDARIQTHNFSTENKVHVVTSTYKLLVGKRLISADLIMQVGCFGGKIFLSCFKAPELSINPKRSIYLVGIF